MIKATQYKPPPAEKSALHPRNLHRERYDFAQLTAAYPPLSAFVRPNPYKDLSIDFADPAAVKALNSALLQHHYGIVGWDIPSGYLCPPIPGRADYLHHIADLLAAFNDGKIPKGKKIRCLDIGVGANAVYPIIGAKSYGWSFVGSDIDPTALQTVNRLLEANPNLKERLSCRLQSNPAHVFQGIVSPDEYFDLSICNPPFYASEEEARASSVRKVSQLKQKEIKTPVLNFGGQSHELICKGGEAAFIGNMIAESKQFARSCFWFSSLISKQSNLNRIYAALEKNGATAVKTLVMGQGNKVSRAVAWTFLNAEQQKAWKNMSWGKL